MADETETEADTCRRAITPRLQAAGWDSLPHQLHEQHIITPGRILFTKRGTRRGERRRADYLLRYRADVPIAVVEAKASYLPAAEGMQQAKQYAIMLDLSFAYSSNGVEILEFDFFTGLEKLVDTFPAPDELWERQRIGLGLDPRAAEVALTPGRPDPKQPLRYYQEAAITRAIEAIASGRRRTLIILCTGSGKTSIAFQIAWRLHAARWTAISGRLRARVLYLADRDVLVKDPQNRYFGPFGDGRHRILAGHAPGSREVFFATYQALLEEGPNDVRFAGLPSDFFDLIIVDECHRGSSRADSAWRTILEHFAAAAQIGMTATPIYDETRDTFAYFGAPLYVYSLRQGIEDGYLAPYKVRRVVTDFDAAGWRPTSGELDRYGQPIPDDEYQTKDFERVVALRARTEAIARHLTEYLRGTDPFAKTLVFCVDQEHADEMRRTLANLNSDLMVMHPDWVCRVTSDEGDVGRTYLERFQDLDLRTPAVLTTSQMLTTGVDAPTVHNVALVRVIGSMSEFKQIIGRGTRVREDYGKTWFTILDYTGTATAKFADPAFDGDPIAVMVEPMDPITGTVPDGALETTPHEDSTANEAQDEGGGTVLVP
ncbi:EcoAI/FtnUII family type I restriction enzme subunit R [Lichenicola cladoniae]|nr:DEAD/DEAH box helicase family protein [Lichenicola cladoniae]